LVICIVIVTLISSAPIANFYHFSISGLWLFRSLVVSLFLSSLKTIPSIKLERRLEFGKLIIPQIAENLVFYIVAVYLAWQGQGITSFTVAVLARSLVGLIIMYILAPWWPKFSVNRNAAKSLLKFGVPFQLNSFLALIKDDFLTAFLGTILPLTQIGYLGWAQKWALFPLRMFMDSINKVTFPAYARLQHHPDALKRAIEKSLFFVSLFISPIIVGLVVTAPKFVLLIPRYQKWEPALLALVFFGVNGMWASISTTITNAFAAIGKIKLNLFRTHHHSQETITNRHRRQYYSQRHQRPNYGSSSLGTSSTGVQSSWFIFSHWGKRCTIYTYGYGIAAKQVVCRNSQRTPNYQ